MSILHKTVVIGACGCIGEFLAKSLAAHTGQLILIDLAYQEPRGNEYNCDLSRIDDHQKLEFFSEVSVVILALSYDILTRIFESILPFLPSTALVVDTCPNKVKIEAYYNQQLKKHGLNTQILSIHPLFRPGLNLVAKPAAYFTKNATKEFEVFITLLQALEWHVFESSAKEQDEALSVIQVNSHALILVLGKILVDSDISFEKLLKFATPPFKLLILLIHRILSGVPKVYWDIQCENTYAIQAREQLEKELNNFSQLIRQGKVNKFNELIEDIKQATMFTQHEDLLQSTFNQVIKEIEPYFIIKDGEAT